MLSLYRHFLTAQLTATSLARIHVPLVDITNERRRHQLRSKCRHTRGKLRCPAPFRTRSARAPHSLPRAAQSSAFAVIALNGHQGDFQEHRRRQMNFFLVAFGDVVSANFRLCIILFSAKFSHCDVWDEIYMWV